jgi:folate-dependent phosphoribosylglycinamide formyltransferase PurN
MSIVCFVSGSGTNYREIASRDASKSYLVFTNRPDCGAVEIARQNNHPVISLDHRPYLAAARRRYGSGNVPRNCPERAAYEQDVAKTIEQHLGRKPDLLCLAGFDQWLSDWMVDRYFPRILNVHPGDTTKPYDGLYWIPAAKAILAGDDSVKSSVFFVDRGEDNGPVLMQSSPLNVLLTLKKLESEQPGLLDELSRIKTFAREHSISGYEEFRAEAGELGSSLEKICRLLQSELRSEGDWKIYPYSVHDLIAAGRVMVDGRRVYVDGKLLPPQGYSPPDTI